MPAEFMALGTESGIAEGALRGRRLARSLRPSGTTSATGPAPPVLLWTQDYLLTLKTDATVLRRWGGGGGDSRLLGHAPGRCRLRPARAVRVASQGPLMRKAHDLLKGANKGAGKG